MVKRELITKANKKLMEIEKIKTRISHLRDDMREKVSEVEDILESLDQGIESVDTGLYELRHGVDQLSELL